MFCFVAERIAHDRVVRCAGRSPRAARGGELGPSAQSRCARAPADARFANARPRATALVAAGALAALIVVVPATARGGVEKRPFGVTAEGAPVSEYVLTAGHLRVSVLTYGGIVRAIEAPDRDGKRANVVLGFARLADYEQRSPHFGALTGRYANRIARARFTLEGKEHRLTANDGPNSLHGGVRGFDKRIWQAREVPSGRGAGGHGVALELRYTSADGEEGFPGALAVTVTYTLTDADELRLDYRATTDKPTVVNLTNHNYYNLAGDGAGGALDEELQLFARRFLPVDETLIPTGELAEVAGTPFDFRAPQPLGRRIRDGSPQLVRGRGYDHTWVIDRPASGPTSGPLGGAHALVLAARLSDPQSGRVLEVETTEPGVQLYTGNFLDGTLVGAAGRAYRQGDGVCLETQHFPDSPNHPAFPSTVLRPGERYETTTVYRFSTIKRTLKGSF
jgi:aldose 1-epimerase